MKGSKAKNVKTVLMSQKGGSLAFKHLPEKVSNQLVEIQNVKELEEVIESHLNLKDKGVNLKSGIVIDYYVSVMWWAKQHMMSSTQLSSVFSVAQIILDNIIEKKMTLFENLNALKSLLAGVGIHESEVEISGGLEQLSVDQVKLLINYFMNGFFQHYRLYEFLSQHEPIEELLGIDLTIESAPLSHLPFPPPLIEGLPSAVYAKYVAKVEPLSVQDTILNSSDTGLENALSPADNILASEAEDERQLRLQSEQLFHKVTPEQISAAVDSVCNEMLSGLELEVINKLKDKENNYINRINKIHKIAD